MLDCDLKGHCDGINFLLTAPLYPLVRKVPNAFCIFELVSGVVAAGGGVTSPAAGVVAGVSAGVAAGVCSCWSFQ